MKKYWFFLLLVGFSFVLANFSYLNQPPILINNPFYSFYRSIVNFTLKLPMSAFAKADILSKAMEESLYNLGFVLETNRDRQELIIDFRKYGFILRDLILGWRNFASEEKVTEELKEIQINTFRFVLTIKYQPFTLLTLNEEQAINQILQSLANETYRILGPEETFRNLQTFEISSEELIYLVNTLFADKEGILPYFADLIDLKLNLLVKEEGISESLQSFQKLAENLLPEKSAFRQIVLEVASTTKRLNELIGMIDENKAYLKDTEKFQALLEAYQDKISLAKELVLAQDLKSTLQVLTEIKALLQQMNELFVLVPEEPPAIKSELLPEATSSKI